MMNKYRLIYSAMIITIVTLLTINISAQEGDDCFNAEKELASRFKGTIFYGNYGASSQLEEKSNPEKYKPGNAFDSDFKTAWVEGKEDDGAGESLTFISSYPVKRIGIMPGYGIEKFFRLNNRLKTAKLNIFSIAERDANQCIGMFYTKGELLKTETLKFEDIMTVQYFTQGNVPHSEKGYIYTIEIVSVYKGSKYNDTCIAEVITE